MVTEIIPVSVISGTSKKNGKEFTILHYIYKDTYGRLQCMQQFGGTDDLIAAFNKVCDDTGSFKKCKGNFEFINGKGYLLNLIS